MNDFIWTDLSTYQLEESVQFYKDAMNWNFQDNNGYFVGGIRPNIDLGIYETPEFFKSIKMPHFWMNYIQVENLEVCEKRAIDLGGKVELSNKAFYNGRIALIRDPMGAGFTIYEGDKLAQSSKTICSRELHVSSIKKVKRFYEVMFDWNLKSIDSHKCEIRHKDKLIARILELDNNEKGKYEYWVTVFKVQNVAKTLVKILEQGGSLISEEFERKLVSDKFNEAFFYISGQ